MTYEGLKMNNKVIYSVIGVLKDNQEIRENFPTSANKILH